MSNEANPAVIVGYGPGLGAAIAPGFTLER